MLTVKKLKRLRPGKIFASGEGFLPSLYKEGNIKWVAVRGQIWDWAIYYHHDYYNEQYVAGCGDKVHGEKTIKELVECDEEAFKMYRY